MKEPRLRDATCREDMQPHMAFSGTGVARAIYSISWFRKAGVSTDHLDLTFRKPLTLLSLFRSQSGRAMLMRMACCPSGCPYFS